jgi:hypothetical protein
VKGCRPISPLFLLTLLLLALITSPYWIVQLPGYSHKDKWLETMAGAGNYHFFAREIYDRTDDVDILVIGDSIMWCGMDTDLIEKELSRQIGRKAVVLSFAANWRGEDLLYLQTKEILAHRRVKMLMINMPVFSEREVPHAAAAYWWVMGEHDLSGIDYKSWLSLYAVSVWGMPRHFLSFLRPNEMLQERHQIRSNTKTGALKEEIGFKSVFRRPEKSYSFDISPESVILSPVTEKNYHFTNRLPNRFQSFFLNRIFALAERHDVHVVVSSVPRYSQTRNELAEEITDYAKIYPGFIETATVQPIRIFGRMGREEERRYFYDEHMNISGAEIYTQAMMPTILSLYAKKSETR